MTTSIAAAIDYIYDKAQISVDGFTVDDQPVIACDFLPNSLTRGMFVVGMEAPIGETSSAVTHVDRQWYGVGGKRLEEDFTIPCYIDIQSAGSVQKTPRDIAVGIFDAFWSLIAADLTLGGILTQGRLADIESVDMEPRLIGTAAEPGRAQLIAFGVHCRNLTT